jgi:hypothetical protein
MIRMDTDIGPGACRKQGAAEGQKEKTVRHGSLLKTKGFCPVPGVNRQGNGLSAIYREFGHTAFLEGMAARLANSDAMRTGVSAGVALRPGVAGFRTGQGR